MGHVFHRHTAMAPPVADRGDGVFVIDAEGKRYLDASGGAAVSCLGHSHPAVTDAIHRQADRLAYAHTGFFTNAAMEALADRLIRRAKADLPGTDLDRAYFVSGGSEAMEAALKLARQYFQEVGQPARARFIARRQSYHGNTLGALAVGGNQWRRRQFEPLLAPTTHVSPCYPYRDQRADEDLDAYTDRLAAELDAAIHEAGPDTVIGFVAEPVVGATAGAVPAVPGYFRKIKHVLDRHGVLLILDEVMCGMGRTGTLFACQQDGVSPDLMAIAKGLGAGYQPIGATLVSAQIFDAIARGTGFFQHGHTYMGHPMACAAALAVLDTLEAGGVLDRVAPMGRALRDALIARFGNHPHVGDIRGRGLFLGLELVADRGSKAPFDPARRLHAKVKQAAFRRGLMVYPMGGTLDGVEGDHVLLAPPFILEDEHLPMIIDTLEAALTEALAA